MQRKQLRKAFLDHRNLTAVDVRESTWNQASRADAICISARCWVILSKARRFVRSKAMLCRCPLRRAAFYEPADAIIANFGNASDTEPMTFVAFYLLDGEQELIRML
jgi:uncharacterized protein YjbI with pentapeptide repeats